MKCGKCQNPIPPDDLFCPKCGNETSPQDNLQSIGNQPTLGRDAEPLSVGDAPTVRSRTWKTGQKVMGRYQILGELGRGGMGVVYKCLDNVGGIEVALKALPPELSYNSSEMEEVRENFQLVSKLVHQHIATVRTLERDSQSGDYFLILELVEGIDVRKWRKQQGGKVPLEKALLVLRQIAQALDYAHSQKIIHRDIKPGNVMVAADGTVKVLDFGLAAQIQSSLSRVSQVHFSTSGTGPYMAPEQWKGQRQDGATDQYALASITYELLSGRVPFDVQDQTALRESAIKETAQRPEEIPDGTWAVLLRALSKEPQQRFANCLEFIEALVRAVNGHEIRISAGKSEIRAHKFKAPLLIVLALFLICAAGWYFGRMLPEENRRKAESAQAEAQARLAKDAQEKAEAERLRIEREKQLEEAKTAAEHNRLAEELLKKRQQDELARKESERLASVKGGLIVKTLPSGATVTLGGEDVQTSPATFKEIKVGKYPLRLSLDGYEPESREVEIKENDFAEVGTIRLSRSVGCLQLSSEPEGAVYELKGAEITSKTGTTPGLEKDLPTGEYTLTMRRGDWEKSAKLSVERGKTSEGKVEFAYGSVSLKTQPAGARVVAEGKDLGRTPLELKDLKPGIVNYSLSLANYKEATLSGSVEGKKLLELSTKLESQPYPMSGERWTNSLGQVLAPVPGVEALFCIWDTRVKDFEVFVTATGFDASGGMFSLRGGKWCQNGDTWKSPGFSQGLTHPVCGVSWEDAKAYCKWLTEKERKEGLISESQSYRLPTDEEWSEAVGLNEQKRGTPKDKNGKIKGEYPWGQQWPPPAGAGNFAGKEVKDGNWIWGGSTIKDYQDGYTRTSPVGSFKANKYGLYDMEGNVCQWCEDFYDGQSGQRVLRGGSWFSIFNVWLVSSFRPCAMPGIRYDYHGFRVVLVTGGGTAR